MLAFLSGNALSKDLEEFEGDLISIRKRTHELALPASTQLNAALMSLASSLSERRVGRRAKGENQLTWLHTKLALADTRDLNKIVDIIKWLILSVTRSSQWITLRVTRLKNSVKRVQQLTRAHLLKRKEQIGKILKEWESAELGGTMPLIKRSDEQYIGWTPESCKIEVIEEVWRERQVAFHQDWKHWKHVLSKIDLKSLHKLEQLGGEILQSRMLLGLKTITKEDQLYEKLLTRLPTKPYFTMSTKSIDIQDLQKRAFLKQKEQKLQKINNIVHQRGPRPVLFDEDNEGSELAQQHNTANNRAEGRVGRPRVTIQTSQIKSRLAAQLPEPLYRVDSWCSSDSSEESAGPKESPEKPLKPRKSVAFHFDAETVQLEEAPIFRADKEYDKVKKMYTKKRKPSQLKVEVPSDPLKSKLSTLKSEGGGTPMVQPLTPQSVRHLDSVMEDMNASFHALTPAAAYWDSSQNFSFGASESFLLDEEGGMPLTASFSAPLTRLRESSIMSVVSMYEPRDKSKTTRTISPSNSSSLNLLHMAVLQNRKPSMMSFNIAPPPSSFDPTGMVSPTSSSVSVLVNRPKTASPTLTTRSPPAKTDDMSGEVCDMHNILSKVKQNVPTRRTATAARVRSGPIRNVIVSGKVLNPAKKYTFTSNGTMITNSAAVNKKSKPKVIGKSQSSLFVP